MGRNHELVSIVIPTYNQAHFLKEALSSIRAQTWAHWEAIVINNHSKDKTREVVESFEEPRFKLHDFANDGVIARSRNLGISLAQGLFIAFLDSDDTWHHDKLKRCVSRLRQGFDLVCHGETHFIDNSPTRYDVTYGPTARTSYPRLLLEGNCLSTSAVVLRRDILQRHGSFATELEFNTAEDYELWLRLAKEGVKIDVINDILGAYRIHPQSSSASAVKNAAATLAVMKAHYQAWDDASIWQALRFNLRAWRIRSFIWRREYFAGQSKALPLPEQSL